MCSSCVLSEEVSDFLELKYRQTSCPVNNGESSHIPLGRYKMTSYEIRINICHMVEIATKQ